MFVQDVKATVRLSGRISKLIEISIIQQVSQRWLILPVLNSLPVNFLEKLMLFKLLKRNPLSWFFLKQPQQDIPESRTHQSYIAIDPLADEVIM
jgi:hypothetical protein